MVTVDGKCGAIFFSRVVQALLPGVMAGIGELKAAAHLFEADTAPAFVGLCLWVIAVGYLTGDEVSALADVDVDVAGLCRRDAMLEGVLDERDEDERGYLRAVLGVDVEVGFHRDVRCQPDAH